MKNHRSSFLIHSSKLLSKITKQNFQLEKRRSINFFHCDYFFLEVEDFKWRVCTEVFFIWYSPKCEDFGFRKMMPFALTWLRSLDLKKPVIFFKETPNLKDIKLQYSFHPYLHFSLSLNPWPTDVLMLLLYLSNLCVWNISGFIAAPFASLAVHRFSQAVEKHMLLQDTF